MPKFEREVEIDAPVEKVWEALTNPRTYPEWFPAIESVSNAATLSEGTRFNWTGKGQTGQAAVVKMEPMKRLEIKTQLGDDQDLHVFTLKPSGGFFGAKADETKIEYTLDTLMGGGILASFIAGGNPMDSKRVAKAMNLLRKMVERV